MVSQTPSDGPFGLQGNVAAGLAYLFGIIGGIVMLLGGGTNQMAKWAAAQSITMWGVYIAYYVIVSIISSMIHFLAIILFPIGMILGLVYLVLWLWTFITAFQGKSVEIPIIGGITRSIFKDASPA